MYHCCCSTHSPPIEWGCKVVHLQHRSNIPSWDNLHTGNISYWVPGEVISLPFDDLNSHWSIRRRASIEYTRIWIGADNIERWPVFWYELEHIMKKGRLCVLRFLFLNLAGFMDQMWGQTSLCVATECDIRSTSFCRWSPLPAIYSTYSKLFYITFCNNSIVPVALIREHVNGQITTQNNDYSFTQWPVWLTIMPWQQFRIFG